MSKIKVSKEVGQALESALENSDRENLLELHLNKLTWVSQKYAPLNELSNWEMAQILINGYEVEKTPEEKALATYNALPSDDDYDCGRRNGIKEVLAALDIKIKGIND